MRKLISFLGLILLLAIALLTLAGWQDWRRFESRPLNPDGEVHLWLEEGAHLRTLVGELQRLGLSRMSWRWRLLGRLEKPLLRAGEYQLETSANPRDLLALVTSGKVVEHRFTIVEGWRVDQLRAALDRDARLASMTAGWSDEELMARLGCADCPAEGWFLPETYFFVRPGSDLALLQRAHEAMKEALASAWETRAADLPLDSADELLVLASLIERETGQATERGQVAGVFVRRLDAGMRLQTDPTVVYGLGADHDGRITREDLRTDHPWNTYTRHGLPPTAIALPGRSSLLAAAHPMQGSSLYFVARGDGSHQFSDTLEEHNAAVNHYLRRRR